jgi:pyrroloquinoline-quinone synthase
MPASELAPWSREEFHEKLKEKGTSYHVYHPFQVMMTEGKLTRSQMQGWVANRFYYQKNIPLKDAAVMANCADREVRREWILRMLDQDGTGDDEGGIEAWLRLGVACGLTREEVLSEEHVLPGVRFAVDAYRNFARSRPWQEAVCSSLTELFAPDAHASRIESFPRHYPWIGPEGLDYFRMRLSEARRDVQHGLKVTLDYFKSRAQQERALDILEFKLDVLWTMLDAMYMAYISQETLPPHKSYALVER